MIGRAEIDEMLADFAEDASSERAVAAWPIMKPTPGAPRLERIYMADAISAERTTTYVVVFDCRSGALAAIRAVANDAALVELVSNCNVPADGETRLGLRFGTVQELG